MSSRPSTLILGIGNVLLGDEGVGVHVVRELEKHKLPPGVECLDGGTGGFQLLDPIQQAGRVILVDATLDEGEPGSVTRLRPRYSKDYPRTLTAHDIGLKDLLDAFYLLGGNPDMTLFAVSISRPEGVEVGLSQEMAARVPEIVGRVLNEVWEGQAAGLERPADVNGIPEVSRWVRSDALPRAGFKQADR